VRQTLGVSVIALILTLLGFVVGQASPRDEATVTVQISSAEHETAEGYFSLGESTTLMVKPGTELYKFLAGHRGRTVRITLTDDVTPQLSRLDRGGK
jgi:hypothetical protein